MSAMQTKNKKISKYFCCRYGLKNREMVRNIAPYASGNENSKIKTSPEHSQMDPNYETADRRR